MGLKGMPLYLHYRPVAIEKILFAPAGPVTAVLFDSDAGEKIALMGYRQDGWWTRVYAVK
jgi:hypothetical protein